MWFNDSHVTQGSGGGKVMSNSVKVVKVVKVQKGVKDRGKGFKGLDHGLVRWHRVHHMTQSCD
jgi:hypothetical protein